jgi:hypothetical protein
MSLNDAIWQGQTGQLFSKSQMIKQKDIPFILGNKNNTEENTIANYDSSDWKYYSHKQKKTGSEIRSFEF